MKFRSTTNQTTRRAMSLIELIAVVTIAGLLAAVAIGRLGVGSLANAGSQADARRLAFDLLAIQRRAIATGDNHYVELASADGRFVGYTAYRVSADGDVPVDSPRVFSAGLDVQASHTRAEFTFEGAAIEAYQFTLSAPDRSWQVTVVPVTGAVRVTEL